MGDTGTDGTYLHGWEDNVVIRGGTYDPGDGSAQPLGIVPQINGTINLYFTHDADDTNWEFVVYQTEIDGVTFATSASYLNAGPTNFDAIQTNIENSSNATPFVRGTFSESLYFDPFLASVGYDEGYGVGYILAVAAINANNYGNPTPGGEWNDQANEPYALGVNAFFDVDPTWGYGAMFESDFYGSTVAWNPTPIPWQQIFIFANTDAYDFAIQNVGLESESAPANDGEVWIVSDDGVRAAKTSAIPEPATMLLLGTGLVGLAGGCQEKKQETGIII